MTEENKKRIEMINRGQIPEGYKNTKVGIVPKEWTIHTISECLKRISNSVIVEQSTQYTEIGIRSHGKGLFYKEPIKGKTLGNKSVFWIEPNCFILNIVFAWEQAIGKTTSNEIGMIASHRFPMYKPINDYLNIDYFIKYLLTKTGTKILDDASPGGAGRNRTLGQEKFMKSKIIVPPLPQQEKIADILTTQDKIIELNQRKIDELIKLKKAYLSKMFLKKGENVPEIRFPGFTDAWEQRKLSDVMTDFIVPMRDKPKEFGGSIPWTRIEDIEGKYLNDSLSGQYVTEETVKQMNLKIIPKSSLIVSSSATFGVVAIVTQDLITNQTFIGLVPNDKDTLNYWYSYFQSDEARKYMKLQSAGSTIFYIAREHFEKMPISVP